MTNTEFIKDVYAAFARGNVPAVLGECNASFKATGNSFRAPLAHVWKIADGKVKSFRQHTDTAVHLRPMQR